MWDALKAVTVNGAYQYFEENEKGTVTPGKKKGGILWCWNRILWKQGQMRYEISGCWQPSRRTGFCGKHRMKERI